MAKKKDPNSKPTPKQIATLTHDEAKRRNIPTAEFESVLAQEDQHPIRVAFDRRDPDLDPQLVWRGKDVKDWSDLVVQAPPLFIQEKVHPKVLVDDLRRQSEAAAIAKRLAAGGLGTIEDQMALWSDFNGLPDPNAKTEFYQHDSNWTNRLILGDSLQVMASLAEREGLRGKVQCIYFDPPYGIKFNSNFQWSTTSRDVKDGNTDHITREPEQVKAFRDTWRDGIHSYLTYLRDRLTVARDLLTESGSIFVQIGDENVHRVRAMMDEIFGDQNFVVLITVQKTGGIEGKLLENTVDYVIWYAKAKLTTKYRALMLPRRSGHASLDRYDQYQVSSFEVRPLSKEEKQDEQAVDALRRFQLFPLYSDGETEGSDRDFQFNGSEYSIRKGTHWKTTADGLTRLGKSDRIVSTGKTVRYKRFVGDVPMLPMTDRWESTQIGTERIYIVQTAAEVVKRCLLMTTDPGDLVLDPTCGSGTTGYVAEQWGRRWITVDTSRVALALARARIMGARYPFYLLADSKEGQAKEAEVTQSPVSTQPTHGNIRHGFVYERVPHVTLKSIANNAEIDVIWEKWQEKLEPLRAALNKAAKQRWEEWQIPREAPSEAKWPDATKKLHADWWQARISRQKVIDASIAAKAESEFLYDKPYEDKKKVRVAGPFTVESLSPHRTLGVNHDDELIDPLKAKERSAGEADFARMVLENLRTSGVQQAHKEDKITFTSIAPWPGKYIGAEGRYIESATSPLRERSARSAEPGEGETPKSSKASRSDRFVDSGEYMTVRSPGGSKGNGGATPSPQPSPSEGEGVEKRAGIFIGPEFGTVGRQDLVVAAREAGDAGFDVLIACAFSYEAHATEFTSLGRLRVLKARMNADLHMASDLKNTGKGNLFVIFGEPDIEILGPGDEGLANQVRVKINGVDVFHPATGEVRSDGADGIACWFIDTDYNDESFFVRHAYFLGANDPYKALKTTLKAEINEEAWATLNSDTSRPFDKPKGGKIAVKVINHLGDEVMKVFKVE